MAKKNPRSKFINIDWIIPRNTHTPSGKILLTIKQRRIFKVMLKENSLLWIGRRSVIEGFL